MPARFLKGQEVRVNAVVPQGPVQSVRMREDGVIFYLISWTDKDGTPRSKWFSEDQLEQV